MQHHNKVFKKALGGPLHFFNTKRGREASFARKMASRDAKRAIRKDTQRIIAEAQEDAQISIAEMLAEHYRQDSYLEELGLHTISHFEYFVDEELFRFDPPRNRDEFQYIDDEDYYDDY